MIALVICEKSVYKYKRQCTSGNISFCHNQYICLPTLKKISDDPIKKNRKSEIKEFRNKRFYKFCR